MKKKLFLPALAVLLTLAFAPVVQAQTTDADTVSDTEVSVEDTNINDSTSEEENITEDLEGVDVPVVEEAPSRFGLFWLGFKERVSLTFTFDPVKKAEKQVAYAEQRMQIAEKIAEKTDDPAVQERVQKMVDRAQELLAKVEDRKDKFLENPDERVEQLLRNVATHAENREAIMDRIEETLQEKLTPEQLERFQTLREATMERAQGILQALDNPNLKEEIKQKLEDVKARIDAKAEETKLFFEEQKQLLEDVKNGVEGAEDELKNLHEDRREALKQDLEDAKERLQERHETEMQLREEAMDGDEEAAAQLRIMQKVDSEVRENMQERVETRQEVREENKASLSPNVVPAKPLPVPVQERVEQRQELRDDILNDPEKLNALMEQKIRESQELLENSGGDTVKVEIEDDTNYSGDELNEDGTYKLEPPEDIWDN